MMKPFKLLSVLSLVVTFAATNAYSVISQTISIVDNGKPLSGAKITLNFPNEPEIEIVDNSEEDDDKRMAFIMFPVDKDYGATGTITIEKNGKKITRLIKLGEPVKYDVSQGDFTKKDDTKINRPAYEISLITGRDFGSSNTETNYSGSNFQGSDSDLNQHNFGIDFRARPFANKALLAGLTFEYFFDDAETGLNQDLHPTPGIDTFLNLTRNFFFMPYIGTEVFAANNSNFIVNAILGVRFESITLNAITDESGGGGVRNYFEDDQLTIDPTIALEGDYTLPFGNANNAPKLRFGIALDYISSADFNATSAVNNFNYNFEAGNNIAQRVYVGLAFPFN